MKMSQFELAQSEHKSEMRKSEQSEMNLREATNASEAIDACEATNASELPNSSKAR